LTDGVKHQKGSRHAHNSVTTCTQFSHDMHTIQSRRAHNSITTCT